jgi:hypothetical protein
MSWWSLLCCSKGFPYYDFVLLLLMHEIVSNDVTQIFVFPWIWCLICQLVMGLFDDRLWLLVHTVLQLFLYFEQPIIAHFWITFKLYSFFSQSCTAFEDTWMIQSFISMNSWEHFMCFCSHVPEFEAKLVCSLLHDRKRNVTCDGLMKLEFYFR